MRRGYPSLGGHVEKVLPARAPTCTQDGCTEGRVCAVCGVTLVEQKTVSATGHTVVTDPAVPATCMKEGLTEGSHCSTCGTVMKAQEKVPLADHTRLPCRAWSLPAFPSA